VLKYPTAIVTSGKTSEEGKENSSCSIEGGGKKSYFKEGGQFVDFG